MGGRGASSSKGAGVIQPQKTTNAKFIENMNEKQLADEIAKEKRHLEIYKNQIAKLSQQSATDKAMQEQFTLGVGGLNAKQIKQMGKSVERLVEKGTALKHTLNNQEIAERRLANLEQAQNEVKGTGQTQKQLQKQNEKNVIKANTTWKWTTTQKEAFDGVSFTPKIIKSGNYSIEGTTGIVRIYKNGKQIGQADKWTQAKAFVEIWDKKGK